MTDTATNAADDTVSAVLALTRWQGDRGTYHLVTFAGASAETLTMHANLHRLEFGRARGFGSIKVIARIGDTSWKTSVFPQNKKAEWILLINQKVMRLENLTHGELIAVDLSLL